jgi:hypothetical protein
MRQEVEKLFDVVDVSLTESLLGAVPTHSNVVGRESPVGIGTRPVDTGIHRTDTSATLPRVRLLFDRCHVKRSKHFAARSCSRSIAERRMASGRSEPFARIFCINYFI